jgi:hypothetical protein
LRNLRVDVGLDCGLEGLGVGTNDLGDLVTVLEEQKGGHGTDAELLSNVGDLVDVELVEAGVGVCAGEPRDVISGDRGGSAIWTHLTT